MEFEPVQRDWEGEERIEREEREEVQSKEDL